MKRFIFLGPPGAGKGTQAVVVAQARAITHVSTGDLLRSAVANQTDLGQKAKAYMDRGDLVPDSLVLGMVEERLAQADAQSGWILDGFPRNVAQAKALDELLTAIHQPLEGAVNFEVPDEILTTRLLSRGRQDDTEPVVRHRLQVYHDQTAPLIAFYQERGLLISIAGNAAVDEVTTRIEAAIA